MKENTGYIYVLTNESFHRENWIKIGYASDVEKRVKDLSGTSVPLPFEVYCTYEIPRLKGKKDPDKLVHDLIAKLNPDLRIIPDREFFEMYPWDAYDMLYAIAQMHDRVDKLVRNDNNSSVKDLHNDNEYSVENHFPIDSDIRGLYEQLKSIILSFDQDLNETPTRLYVTYKKGKRNTVSLWPRKECIEVVLNAKIGQITDKYELTYDISNRQWSSEQYAFKFFRDTEIEAVKDIISQTISLKK